MYKLYNKLQLFVHLENYETRDIHFVPEKMLGTVTEQIYIKLDFRAPK